MHPLSPADRQAIDELARRHGFGVDATLTMRDALIDGNGTMAQFNHPEFAGPGQWMRGGMTMVSDMFDDRLKERVDALCRELADLVAHPASTAPAREGGLSPRRRDAGSLPADRGRPDSSGSQNGMRYAYFADANRLVVEADGKTTVYDTLDHRIGGCSQQQSDGGTLGFTSQHGRVDLGRLPVVSIDDAPPVTPDIDAPIEQPAWFDTDPPERAPAGSARELLATIEGLAALHAKGILSDDEFTSKKTELLDRL
jgi:hypothetical protein